MLPTAVTTKPIANDTDYHSKTRPTIESAHFIDRPILCPYLLQLSNRVPEGNSSISVESARGRWYLDGSALSEITGV
jgi:hypothetical protein